MTINLKLFLLILSCFISMLFGSFILARNSDGCFKHNILMGLVGAVFTVVYPIFVYGITH